jgi:uncharacterized protein YceK
MRLRLLVVLLTLAGCGSTTAADAGSPDAGAPDAGPGCSTNPTTHLELINACTSATAIVRTPNLPLLQADGGVPPLP